MRYSMWQDYTDALEPHPFDDGFWLSGGDALEDPPADVTAVSLCRVGREQTAGVEPGNHVVVWLLDEADPEDAGSLMAERQLDELPEERLAMTRSRWRSADGGDSWPGPLL